jgi:hypothetical protein
MDGGQAMVADELEVFESLANARWPIARRTYGNNHATLIGLMVGWWIERDMHGNWALESGPGVRLPEPRGTERRHCDAIFGRGEGAVGLLEVEGMRQSETAAKIGFYLTSADSIFAGLRFAILVCYSCGATGPAGNKTFPLDKLSDAKTALMRVSADSPDRDCFLVVVDKVAEDHVCGIRQGKYYSGHASGVRAYWYRAGALVRERVLFTPRSSAAYC